MSDLPVMSPKVRCAAAAPEAKAARGFEDLERDLGIGIQRQHRYLDDKETGEMCPVALGELRPGTYAARHGPAVVHVNQYVFYRHKPKPRRVFSGRP